MVFLVAVDLIVLVAFTITEEINGNLTFELRNDVENPSGTVKVQIKVKKFCTF